MRCDAAASFDCNGSSIQGHRVATWMRPWFACPPVLKEEVFDMLPREQQISVPPGTHLFPCYGRLAMGCSHSVHILMTVNVYRVGRTLLYNRSAFAPVPPT